MNSTCQSSGGLAAGTLVTTPDGDKKIEDVKAGDLVSSGCGDWDADFYEVKKTSSKPYRGPMLQITAGRLNQQVRVTPNHICFGKPDNLNSSTDNDLSKDSILLWGFGRNDSANLAHIIVEYKNIESAYDIPVEIFHNLDEAEEATHKIAQSFGGVDVHKLAFFERHQCFLFIPAADLKVSMKIPIVTKDNIVLPAEITNITEEQYDGLVYDLDIPEARNFAANGVLVHDSTRRIS